MSTGLIRGGVPVLLGYIRCAIVLPLLLLLCLLTGCNNGIGVRRVTEHNLIDNWKSSIVGKDNQLSPRTQQTLRQLNLEDLYNKNATQSLARLHDLAVLRAEPDILFSLSEISYQIGRKLEKRDRSEAMAYYYLCAGYAYHFLFAIRPDSPDIANIPGYPTNHSPEEAFDPRFRLACDLYNNGLEKCIRAAQKVGKLDPRQDLDLQTSDGGRFALSVTHHGFPWHPDEFGPLLFCSDYRVTGLDNHYRTYGLGVPLIGTRADSKTSAPGRAFYPREVSFPVTAFFRFHGTVADLGARRAGKLELYNPMAIRKIKVQQRVVPLETDLTTPLAYFLNRTDLNGIELPALFCGDDVKGRAGIYLFEPYQPGKIPVLMVHGLFSSPLTWTPLFNELRSDPVLNKHYQFWFYLYPSGAPYLASAADLRMALQTLRDDIDPQHQDPALDKMVLVGHSMGGLVSKLLTQNSGHDFWHLVSKEPLDELKVSVKAKEKLREIFYFEREPAVKRVIFLGTPHRGSKLSPSLIGRLTTQLIRLPKGLVRLAMALDEHYDMLTIPRTSYWGRRLPTSVDLLNPSSSALRVLADRPAMPDVQYHSIIGIYSGEGKASHDGVVTYDSAHIESATSEVMVPGHHIGLHHQPGSMLEVRRILYEHLISSTAPPAQNVLPVPRQLPIHK